MRKLEPWFDQGYEVRGAYFVGKTLMVKSDLKENDLGEFPPCFGVLFGEWQFSLGKRDLRI